MRYFANPFKCFSSDWGASRFRYDGSRFHWGDFQFPCGASTFHWIAIQLFCVFLSSNEVLLKPIEVLLNHLRCFSTLLWWFVSVWGAFHFRWVAFQYFCVHYQFQSNFFYSHVERFSTNWGVFQFRFGASNSLELLLISIEVFFSLLWWWFSLPMM